MSLFRVNGSNTLLVNRSLSCFPAENTFRQRCIMIQASPVLDSLVNLIIILHTYFLGLVHFRDHASPVNQKLSPVLFLFSLFYLLEIGVKVVA